MQSHTYWTEEVRRGLGKKRGICLLVSLQQVENELYIATMFLQVVNGLKSGRLRRLSLSSPVSFLSQGYSERLLMLKGFGTWSLWALASLMGNMR
jgi:hypothetical protein